MLHDLIVPIFICSISWIGEASEGCLDPSGWVVLPHSGSGTIGAWELHHALKGEQPRPPRKVYAFEPPGGGPAVGSCLLAPQTSGARSLVSVDVDGALHFWSDVRTQLGQTVAAVGHRLILAPGDSVAALIPLGPNDCVVGAGLNEIF